MPGVFEFTDLITPSPASKLSCSDDKLPSYRDWELVLITKDTEFIVSATFGPYGINHNSIFTYTLIKPLCKLHFSAIYTFWPEWLYFCARVTVSHGFLSREQTDQLVCFRVSICHMIFFFFPLVTKATLLPTPPTGEVSIQCKLLSGAIIRLLLKRHWNMSVSRRNFKQVGAETIASVRGPWKLRAAGSLGRMPVALLTSHKKYEQPSKPDRSQGLPMWNNTVR